MSVKRDERSIKIKRLSFSFVRLSTSERASVVYLSVNEWNNEGKTLFAQTVRSEATE